MPFIGRNLFWFAFGGVWIGVIWILVGVLCCCTIIGRPFGIACFRIAVFSFFPFGKKLVKSESADVCTARLNFIWIVFAGFWLALGFAILGVAFCITIMGIPWGIECFNMAQASFAPLGKKVVKTKIKTKEIICENNLLLICSIAYMFIGVDLMRRLDQSAEVKKIFLWKISSLREDNLNKATHIKDLEQQIVELERRVGELQMEEEQIKYANEIAAYQVGVKLKEGLTYKKKDGRTLLQQQDCDKEFAKLFDSLKGKRILLFGSVVEIGERIVSFSEKFLTLRIDKKVKVKFIFKKTDREMLTKISKGSQMVIEGILVSKGDLMHDAIVDQGEIKHINLYKKIKEFSK